MRAPVGRVLEAARNVERWPELLRHYRWVRMLERRGDGGLVEMAAWRPFRPTPVSTWWVSEIVGGQADRPRCINRHVRGITTGMDVVWNIQPAGEETDVTIVHEWDGPKWPLIGRAAADVVIGPVFIHGIASLTLAGIRREVERMHAEAAQKSSSRAIGAVTPIGIGVEGLWTGLRDRRSAVRCITRFDPSVFKSRIAARWTAFRRHRPHRGASRPPLDRYSAFSIAATRMALADATLDLRREDPDTVAR